MCGSKLYLTEVIPIKFTILCYLLNAGPLRVVFVYIIKWILPKAGILYFFGRWFSAKWHKHNNSLYHRSEDNVLFDA